MKLKQTVAAGCETIPSLIWLSVFRIFHALLRRNYPRWSAGRGGGGPQEFHWNPYRYHSTVSIPARFFQKNNPVAKICHTSESVYLPWPWIFPSPPEKILILIFRIRTTKTAAPKNRDAGKRATFWGRQPFREVGTNQHGGRTCLKVLALKYRNHVRFMMC